MDDITRRKFVQIAMAASAIVILPPGANKARQGSGGTGLSACSLTINNRAHNLSLDPRTTLLDLLRERLQMPGTKKGCDHGQCGACTVLVNGRRELSCLSLAIAHDGDKITTIEGLANGDKLHPMQAAFLDHDGFQCGYCTPGQICSAVAMVEEARQGVPSVVTKNLARPGPIQLTDEEIRERMAGNICRCGAYPNIVAAVRSVANGEDNTK